MFIPKKIPDDVLHLITQHFLALPTCATLSRVNKAYSDFLRKDILSLKGSLSFSQRRIQSLVRCLGSGPPSFLRICFTFNEQEHDRLLHARRLFEARCLKLAHHIKTQIIGSYSLSQLVAFLSKNPVKREALSVRVVIHAFINNRLSEAYVKAHEKPIKMLVDGLPQPNEKLKVLQTILVFMAFVSTLYFMDRKHFSEKVVFMLLNL